VETDGFSFTFDTLLYAQLIDLQEKVSEWLTVYWTTMCLIYTLLCSPVPLSRMPSLQNHKVVRHLLHYLFLIVQLNESVSLMPLIFCVDSNFSNPMITFVIGKSFKHPDYLQLFFQTDKRFQ